MARCNFVRLGALNNSLVDKEFVACEYGRILSLMENDKGFMLFFNANNSSQDLRKLIDERLNELLLGTIKLDGGDDFMETYNLLTWEDVRKACSDDIFEYLMMRVA